MASLTLDYLDTVTPILEHLGIDLELFEDRIDEFCESDDDLGLEEFFMTLIFDSITSLKSDSQALQQTLTGG